nr:SPASM domain-containing protein [Treponema sp.]
FDLESVEELIGGYKMLYDRFFEDIRKGDYSLIDLLRDDYCFTGIKLLLGKGRLSRRCGWNEDTIFDSKGDVYPCDYFVGRKEFLRGGIGSEKIVDVCAEKLDVDNREKCKDCWCKYLCGGTCYFNSMAANGDIGVPDPVECRLNMGVRELCLKFVQRLLENGVDLYKFGKRIGIYYDDRVSFEKRFFVRKGARFLVEGTLSKVEMEIKRMVSVLVDAGARCKEEIYITVKGMKNVGRGTGAVDGAGAGDWAAAGVNKVLCAEVVVPFDGNVEFGGEIGTGVVHNCTGVGECAGGERGTVGDEREQGRGTCFRSEEREQGRGFGADLELVREFDFGECVSGECNSKEQTVEWMKGLLGNAARNFGMMIDGSFWFKARPEAFFGYKEGLVKVFLIKQKNIF